MKKAFIIIVSLFLVFTSFSCVNKKTPTKEEPKQVEKTPEQEPSTPVIPDEKEPVEPVKPKVKHKITYVVPDYVKVDNLPTEYVEGEGLDVIGEPLIDNSNAKDEDEKNYFAYWYIDDEETPIIDFSEVVMSISKNEARDLVLTARILPSRGYKMMYGKLALDIKDKTIYPFVSRNCFSSFPSFHFYGKIKIDKTKTPEKIKENNKTYYKLYCDVEHIYGNDFLKSDINKNMNFGNTSYINEQMNVPYFIYMAENKYKMYSSCDEFIMRLTNYNEALSINDDTHEATKRQRYFPFDDTPITIIEKDGEKLYDYDFLDFYPIVDNTVYVVDQSMFTTDPTKPYIYETYRYYINKNVTDNPTLEEFDIWLKECMLRVYDRMRYNGIAGL